MPLHQILLFPFSALYDAATRLRNHLYDIGTKPVIHFETITVSVGNLAVGGTGKSPMVEYLVRLLKGQYKVATLSRGYGRKTKGFILASEQSTAASIGDEPMQFYRKFGAEVAVAVGEERAIAIPEILFHHSDTEVIILDDAFQHRKVGRDLNILLTAYHSPFFKDHVLPAGRLREARKGAHRADIVVVTKCPPTLDEKDKTSFSQAIREYAQPDVPIFLVVCVMKNQRLCITKHMPLRESSFWYLVWPMRSILRNLLKPPMKSSSILLLVTIMLIRQEMHTK